MNNSAIAIVGMAGRFPGARNITEFWQNLRDGKETIRHLSDAELLAGGARPEELADPDYIKVAAVLDDLEYFDASFFGFSPKDASIMDPQHRHFLECAWEALEHAGHSAEGSPGSIGVFAGSGMNTYLIYNLLTNRRLVQSAGLFLLKQTGNDKDVLATRVSYQLNLRGPSINIQTACSTSLVAVHLACQSLLNHECDMALAGGVTIEIPHGRGYIYREGEILSRDGHCRSFDASSSGTVFSSGLGLVVLRRLEDALEDNDTIHAVILGSAVNNDGSRKIGYLAPSVEGQAEVIAEAIGVAGVSASSISYVETHGTGTIVGDPIEIKALTQAFAQTTHAKASCAVGSLKSAVGHMDAAAGVAGLIKTVLALEHKQIPASLHFRTPNPLIDFANSPFYVNAQLAEWKSDGTPRRAGVTSLGIGGTNVHVVLEEAPEQRRVGKTGPYQLIVLSAKTEGALDRAATNFAEYLQQHPELSLADIAFTLQAGRKAFSHRCAIVARDTTEAAKALVAGHGKSPAAGPAVSPVPGLGFMFSGQGSQYAGMARELYETQLHFSRPFDVCAERLLPELGVDIRSLTFPSEKDAAAANEKLNQTWLTQPVLFAIEYSLAQWWMALGVRPQTMLGHSIGEYTAACLSGVISLDDALMISAARGRLMQSMPSGSMLAVPLAPEEISLADSLSVAAVNGPKQCVVSGPSIAVEKLEKQLQERGVSCRRLHASHAFHSAMMDPILESFAERLRQVRLRPPEIPFLSNVSGTWITAQEATDPGYWVKHLRSTVRFSDCLSELYSDAGRILVEVGPGQVLASLARQHPLKNAKVFSSVRHPQENISDVSFLLNSLGQIWVCGQPVDWKALHVGEPIQRIPLPTYPFERQRHWIDPGTESLVDAAPTVPLPAREAASRDCPANWFHRRVWHRTELPSALATEPSSWLVFMDSLGLGAHISSQLKASGHEVIQVSPGKAFKRIARGHYSVRPGMRPDYDVMVAEVLKLGKPLKKIVHLWPVMNVSSTVSLKETLDASFYSLLFLAQALGDQDLSGVDIAVISNFLQSIAGEPVFAPARATLLGPAKTISKELPGITCRSIDVDFKASGVQKVAAQIITETLAPSSELVLAYRGSERWIESLERLELPSEENRSRLKPNGVYLITGGLGGIGLVVAEHLARASHARLVLIGRTELPPPAEWKGRADSGDEGDAVRQTLRKLLEIESLGGEILPIRADVTRLEEMQQAVAAARQRFGSIDGVIHAAGVSEDGPLQTKSRESAARVLGPKVHGTLVLEEVFRDSPLDFFVLFSSVSSLVPPAGQVDYAAANAFLDSFAASKRETSTLAINWGLWSDVGMGARRTAAGHPLLERRILNSKTEIVYSSQFNRAKHWVLDEHRFKGGDALAPGTAYLEMAVAGLGPFTKGIELRDIFFLAPLSIGSKETREVRLKLKLEGHTFQFSVFANGASWTECATGQIFHAVDSSAKKHDLADLRKKCNLREISFSTGQRTKQEDYLEFGSRWRNLKRIFLGSRESLAVLELPEEFANDLRSHSLHPALFDLATGAALYLVQDYDSSKSLYLPISYRKISIHERLPGRVYSYIRSRGANSSRDEIVTFDITILDEEGNSLIEIVEFSFRKIDDPSGMSRTGVAAGGAYLDSKMPWLDAVDKQTIAPGEGVEALTRILSADYVKGIAVSPQNLKALTQSEEARRIPSPGRLKPAGKKTVSGDETESHLMRIWQDLLGVESVGLQDNFFDLGGHSLLAARLSARVKKIWGTSLPIATLFQAPTVEKLAALLRDKQTPKWSARIAPIKPDGSRAPFLCVDAGPFFRRLAQRLNPDQPFLGLRLADTTELPTHFTLADIAAYHIQTIREIQSHGPYYLGGWSASGLVAYEVAQQLRSQGEKVELLALFDVTNSVALQHSTMLDALRSRVRILTWKLRYHSANLWQLKMNERWGYIRESTRQLLLNATRMFWVLGDRMQRLSRDRLSFAPREPSKAVFVASKEYLPKPYSGRVVLFRGAIQSMGPYHDYKLGWGSLVEDGLKICEMPGDHNDMFFEPHVDLLARELEQSLLKRGESTSPVASNQPVGV